MVETQVTIGRCVGDQLAIPCVFMRGGSSRGAFLLESDLPSDPYLRDRLLLAMYGSPDSRQIDGIGGADPLTSKAIIVRKSQQPDVDVEYTFAQIGIEEPKVSYGGNCGNMLAGVGPFAIDRGLVQAVEPVTTVRIVNLNTNQRIEAEVPVVDLHAQVQGDCRIAGVPGSGAAIRLSFLNVSGAVTGKLLPTGNSLDVVHINSQPVRVSLVDAATPFIFVHAADLGFLGIPGNVQPDQLSVHLEWLDALEVARGQAAVWCGLVDDAAKAREVTPNIPRVAMVSSPCDYLTTSGHKVIASDIDIVGRQLSMQRPHRTYAATGAICTAVASKIPGTVVNLLARPRCGNEVRIGHPAGIFCLEVEVTVDTKSQPEVRRATVERTTRRIMDGNIYVPKNVLE